MFCGVRLADRVPMSELYARLGVGETVGDLMRVGRLRWFGHVECRGEGNLLSSCRMFEVCGRRLRGCPKKTWDKCKAEDMCVGVTTADVQDRVLWGTCCLRWRASRTAG